MLLSRSQPQTELELVLVLDENVKLFHGVKGYKLSKGKTSNQAWREKIDIDTQRLDLEMHKIELQKLNLIKLGKEGVLGIDPFPYSFSKT